MRKIFLLLIVGMLAIGCTTHVTENNIETEEVVVDYQTHVFYEEDQMVVMNAVLQVFYEQGFLIRTAHTDAGFITADIVFEEEYYTEEEIIIIWSSGKRAKMAPKNHEVETTIEWWVVDEYDDEYYYYEDIEIIEASAHVIPYGGGSKIMMNFQRTMVDAYGDIVSVEHIDDVDLYYDFYQMVAAHIDAYYAYY